MKKRLLLHLVPASLLAASGCAAPPRTTITWETPGWEDRTVIGWRLTERSYGDIDDPWSAAGDGEIPADEPALVFEPVYEEAPSPTRDSQGDPDPVPGPCLHILCLAYEGAGNEGIGNRAEMQF